jgi:predicted nucleotidyltransferase
MKQIRDAARRIADEVKVERIILFGSYAYGAPGRASDVDLLVVTNTRQRHSELRYKLYTVLEDFPAPLDIIFRRPKQIAHVHSSRDWFLRDVVRRGSVVYG